MCKARNFWISAESAVIAHANDPPQRKRPHGAYSGEAPLCDTLNKGAKALREQQAAAKCSHSAGKAATRSGVLLGFRPAPSAAQGCTNGFPASQRALAGSPE
jgi:hypothetical protein